MVKSSMFSLKKREASASLLTIEQYFKISLGSKCLSAKVRSGES